MNPSQKKMVQWLLIMIGLLVVGGGLCALLIGQGFYRTAQVEFWITAIAALAWLFWGLWCRKDIRFIKVTGGYIASGLLVLLIGFALLSSGKIAGAISIVGMWGMAVAFVVGLLFIRMLLRGGWPVFGVARTLIDEAIRMKVALVFIVGLLLLVPILPIVTSEQERLGYRIQAFISWSVTATSILLGLLTMFLACSTIAGEISSKRIFMTMTKPITRLQFLIGKWLGIVLLDALLLAVAGMTIFVFARVLQQQPATMLDRVAVDQQVLVAREAVTPVPPSEMAFASRFEQRLEKLRIEQPQRYGDKISESDRQAIQKSIIASWQTIAPGQSSTFVFRGLQEARKYEDTLIQLRFKAQSAGTTPDEMVHLGFRFNDGQLEQISVADANFHVKNLFARSVDAKGEMKLEVFNLAPPIEQGGLSVSFPPGDGMEVLYRTGSFEGNLARGLFVTLIKLAFIAMLGLAAGTFLSFPVAVLLTMLVFCTAAGSEFLAESLRYYAGYTTASGTWEQLTGIFSLMWTHLTSLQFYDLFKLIIRLVGESFVAITPAFGRYDTTVSLADGRMIPWSLTFDALWRIGILGTGLCGVVGWAIFQKRELARVTV